MVYSQSHQQQVLRRTHGAKPAAGSIIDADTRQLIMLLLGAP